MESSGRLWRSEITTGPQHFDLASLINPIAPEAFWREHWEKRPLHIERRNPDYYASLLTLADIDKTLDSSHLQPGDVVLVREGETIPLGTRAGVVSPEALYAGYRDGATILLPSLHRQWAPLDRLCRQLSVEFSSNLQVNAYLTPPDQKGLHVHYDTHDVFVVQVAGSKHWRLYEAPITMPLRGQPYHRETAVPVQLLSEFDLYAGDCLYIPRGHVHDAVATDRTSLHLAVGVNTITWASVISSVLEAAIENDWRFRESLPIGFAAGEAQRKVAEARLEELVAALKEHVNAPETIGRALGSARSEILPALNGHLLDLEALDQVQFDTPLMRRPEYECEIATDGDAVTLEFHEKAVRMPAHVAPDLAFIAKAERFTASDLPGILDEPSSLVLVRRLIREGLLTISRNT